MGKKQRSQKEKGISASGKDVKKLEEIDKRTELVLEEEKVWKQGITKRCRLSWLTNTLQVFIIYVPLTTVGTFGTPTERCLAEGDENRINSFKDATP